MTTNDRVRRLTQRWGLVQYFFYLSSNTNNNVKYSVVTCGLDASVFVEDLNLPNLEAVFIYNLSQFLEFGDVTLVSRKGSSPRLL